MIVFPLVKDKVNYMTFIITEMKNWMFDDEFFDCNTYKIRDATKFEDKLNSELDNYKTKYLLQLKKAESRKI